MPHEAAKQLLKRVVTERIGVQDRHGAVAAVLEAVETGAVSIRDLYGDVLGPLLIDEGERWQHGVEHVWQEHYATAVVRTIVEALAPAVARHAAGAPNGSSVLLACPPQEPHDLGLRMLADRFELAGWRAYFLGADVPAEEIVAATAALRPDMLVLTAATHYNRVELRDVIGRIRPSLPAGLRLRVTGQAFRSPHPEWPAAEVLDPDHLPER